MKRCIACGMPMQTAAEYPNGDISKNYCIHCSRPDGSMQSFQEKKASMTGFLIRTQGLDEKAAEKMAESRMKQLPAWKKYFL